MHSKSADSIRSYLKMHVDAGRSPWDHILPYGLTERGHVYSCSARIGVNRQPVAGSPIPRLTGRVIVSRIFRRTLHVLCRHV